MTNQEFEKIIAGSQFGRKKENPPSLEAARIYFVGGEANMSECARLAGCTKQGARAAIKRIEELIAAQGMMAVQVLVPKGKKGAIEKQAALLRSGK